MKAVIACLLIAFVFSQVNDSNVIPWTCSHDQMELQVNQAMTPISCSISSSRSDFNPRITPSLPAGMYYDVVKSGSLYTVTISGTPVEGQTPQYFYIGYNNWVSRVKLTVFAQPTYCSYGFDVMSLYTDIIMEPIPIHCNTAMTSFSVNPELPEGMTINTTTGTISGTLKSFEAEDLVYTVTASNSYGSTTTIFTFQALDQSEMTTPGMIGCYWSQITECQTPEFDFFYNTPAQHCQTIGEVRFTDNNVDNTWPGLDSRFLDYYSAYFYSYIVITIPGTYEFALSSDDGAILYIDDLETPFITRGGCRALDETYGTKTLSRGRHLAVIRYLEYNQWASMYLKMGSTELQIEMNYVQANQLRVGGRGPTFIEYGFIGGYAGLDMATYRPNLSSGAPVSWTVEPSLPEGISIDTLGYISGRPSAASSGTYTVTAHGVNGAASTTVRIVITAAPMNGVHANYYKVTDTSDQICNYAKLVGNALQLSQSNIFQANINFESVPEATVWQGFPPDFTSYFYMEYEGYLKMETVGNWKFRLTCTDGCKLIGADEQVIVNNWGCNKSTLEATFPVSKNGYYYFRIEYMQVTGQKELKFEWQAPNSYYEVVPLNKMFYVPTGVLSYANERAHYFKGSAIEENIPILFSISNLSGYSIVPALPAGLSINPSNGRITGTPSATQPAVSYTVSANAGSTKETTVITFDILDIAAPSNIAYYYNGATVSAQTPINLIPLVSMSSLTISNSGAGAVSRYTVNPALPAGLSLNTASGTISGTPTEAKANTVYTIMAINAAGSFPIVISLSVSGCKGSGWVGEFIHVTFHTGSGTVAVVDASEITTQCSVNTMLADGNAASVTCQAGVDSSSTLYKSAHFCLNPATAGSLKIKTTCTDNAGCRWQVSRDGGVYYPHRLAYDEVNYAPYYDSVSYPITATPLTLLTVEPATITAFNGIEMEFVKVTVNGNYKSFTINPPMGDVAIDPTYPVLSGIITGTGTTVYTITATGDHGTAQGTLTVNFQLCSASSGKQFVTFKKYTKSYGQEESWSISKDGQTITTQSGFIANSVYSNSFCLDAGEYVITMNDSYGDGWSSGANLYAYDENENLLATFFFQNPGSTSIKTATDTFTITTYTTEWRYLIDKRADRDWKNSNFDASSWQVAPTGVVGQWSQNGIYFIHQFELTADNYQSYPIIEFGIYYKDGAIVYLNGNEVYRRNIASSSTNHNTEASSTFDGYLIRVGTAAGHLLVAGKNTLAVELHRYPGVQGNIEWNAYVTFKEGDCITRSVGGSITESQFYDKAGETAFEAWDNDSTTQWTENGLPAWTVYSYNFDHVEWINRITIGGCIDSAEWQNRNPAKFTIYGSNDGLNWETLYSYEKKNMFTTVGEVRSFMLMDHMNSYGKYKFEINNSASGVAQTSVSKLALEACRLVYCPKENDWPGTLAGETVTIDCAEGFIGERYRACGEQKITPVWGEADERECRSKYPTSKELSYIDSILVIAPQIYINFISNAADVAVQTVISNILGIDSKNVEVWKVKDVSDTFVDDAMVDQSKVAVYVRVTVANEIAADTLNKFTSAASEIAQNFKDYYQDLFTADTRVSFMLVPELNQYQGLGKVSGWLIFFFIVVILIVCGVIGFYAWTRLKNKKYKNGAKKLKAGTQKKDKKDKKGKEARV